MMGIAKQRSLPVLSLQTLNNWYINYQQKGSFRSSVYLFNDEFTNYHHYTIGVKCIKLLNSLGYKVIIPQHLDSGRAFISKGLLEQAKVLANYNIQALSSKVSETCPIIGHLPS
jgi:Fe-S oxidoreductase